MEQTTDIQRQQPTFQPDDQAHQCVILANGLFPQSERALSILRTARYICCCDGAVQKLLAAGLEPHVIVGDGDSISDTLRQRYADRFIHIAEQEYNDLTKATLHCRERGYRRITYLGATGLREDHTIGNIFLLPYYLDTLGIQPTLITDHGTITAHHGTHTFTSHPRQQVSIFNITATHLAAAHLRWPLRPFTQLWQGTLNESLAPTFTIQADGTYLVFREES